MSYVPQTTEHIRLTSIAASGSEVVDVTVPPECIIEKVEVLVKDNFNAATSVTLNVGTSSDANYFTATSVNISSQTDNTYATPQLLMTPVSSLPADRIVRFTFANSDASNAGTGDVYCYVVYRFPPNGTPTRVA